ncbi:MAG: DUF368 domain-containing protein [Corynebacterium sp.]|nr:DUF368 domain-containing protein [Corynebacterium sp.]
MPSHTPAAASGKQQSSIFGRIFEFVAGCLIGLAELVPGISGGTVALVMGIYERALRNADALMHLVRVIIRDRSKTKEAAKEIEWMFLAMVGLGMVGIVLTMAGVMHSFVDNHSEVARGLFLGMVAVSIYVPVSMLSAESKDENRTGAIIGFTVAAIVTFFATGITSAEKTDPSLIMIFFAAAIAVCALVLPGISGSYLLLAMGLYTYVTGAVDDRNLTVMLVFALGAVTGLACFIKALTYLLNHHHTVTLATMAGVMLGSLRSLWPWQSEDADLLAPSGDVFLPVLMIIIGALFIVAIIIVERRFSKRADESELPVVK